MADIIYTNFAFARKRSVNWWYVLIAGAWMIIGCVITGVMEQFGVGDLSFLLNAAFMGGFAMALYVPLTLYMNLKFLPKSARPSWICTIFTSIAALVYIGFAIGSLFWQG